MDFDTTLSAQYAGTKLDSLVNRAHRDTMKLVDDGDIPLIVKHFAALRTEYRAHAPGKAYQKAGERGQ